MEIISTFVRANETKSSLNGNGKIFYLIIISYFNIVHTIG